MVSTWPGGVGTPVQGGHRLMRRSRPYPSAWRCNLNHYGHRGSHGRPGPAVQRYRLLLRSGGASSEDRRRSPMSVGGRTFLQPRYAPGGKQDIGWTHDAPEVTGATPLEADGGCCGAVLGATVDAPLEIAGIVTVSACCTLPNADCASAYRSVRFRSPRHRRSGAPVRLARRGRAEVALRLSTELPFRPPSPPRADRPSCRATQPP